MTAEEIIALAEAGAKLIAIATANVRKARDTLAAEDLGTLKAILDPLHQENITLGAELDALLAAAQQK